MRYLKLFLVVVLVGCGFWLWYRFKDKGKVDNKKVEVVDCKSLAGLDGDICKFLKYESPYTVEEMSKKMLKSKRGVISKLGLEDFSSVEGLLIDYRQANDYILLILGFDGKNDNERFVVPLSIPLYAIEDDKLPTTFSFWQVKNFDLTSEKESFSSKNRADIISRLEIIKGKVILVLLTDVKIEDKYPFNSKNKDRLILEVNNTLNLSRTLLGKVNGNDLTSEYSDFDYGLITVKNTNDVEKVNFSQLPTIAEIIIYSTD